MNLPANVDPNPIPRPNHPFLFLLLLACSLLLLPHTPSQAQPGNLPAAPQARATLVKALLSDDLDEQAQLLQQLIGVDDPAVLATLAAWRGGEVFQHEDESDGSRTPFILDAQLDDEGRARALRVADGSAMQDADGQPLLLAAPDLTPIDASSRLRRLIKTVLDLHALGHSDPRMRRDAVVKLGQEQNLDYLPHFSQRLATETVPEVRKALDEAVAITELAAEDPARRLDAVRRLEAMRSINGLAFLQNLQTSLRDNPADQPAELAPAVRSAVKAIETYMAWGNLFGTAFRGLSLSAVLLVAALGLAITFGLMGVINMAHGEIIMVGAYTAYVTQNLFTAWFGATGPGFDAYFLVALAASFFVAGLVGLALERGIIRFLYRRPLESLLATWGVSLVLQQLFRHIFGAANVQVTSPRWLSGSFVVNDVLLAYNRIFVIGFAVAIVVGTFLVLTRTSLGLQVRAVMQNRAMASALGVRTDRVNMATFAFGSGLAGMAGACLSQIGNVGPGLGQNYIVDCFMVVVLGGVGSLIGSVWASLGVGVTDQILQPWLGAVMGKITVLSAIILFLQWRPAGLFATRGRGLEG